LKPFNLGHMVDLAEFDFQNVRSLNWQSAATVLEFSIFLLTEMIAQVTFVDILTGQNHTFFCVPSDGIEVYKSYYSHRSFSIHLSEPIYGSVQSLRVRHVRFNASPTCQTCIFVLKICCSHHGPHISTKWRRCKQHVVYRICTDLHEDCRSFHYVFNHLKNGMIWVTKITRLFLG
jgi:hypothetical protein